MDIIHIGVESMPAARFIGKKFGQADSVNGNYGAQWGKAFETGLFDTIEKAAAGNPLQFEDAGAYIGLMREDNGKMEYWIGMYTAPGTPVPEGMAHVDFQTAKLAMAWARGMEAELYASEGVIISAICKTGAKPIAEGNGAGWYIERYQCPRFTTPDEMGRVILDVGFYTE